MYCGSCFRDNALAAELLLRGHDAHLIPVYTPTRVDEPNVSDRKVLFGGISVYLQHASPWFARLPRAFDRVWDAPGVISAFANRSMSTDPALLGGMAVADPNPEKLAIYVSGSGGASFSVAGHFYGVVYAPASTVTLAGGGIFTGAFLGKAVNVVDASVIRYDVSLLGR